MVKKWTIFGIRKEIISKIPYIFNELLKNTYGMFFAELSRILMKKEKNELPGFNEIRIITTGYSRPGAQNAENEVNRLLREGWTLLETYTTCYSNTSPLSSQQEVHFVLGKKVVAQPEQSAETLQA
jgi:hypothetical protein